MAEKTIKCVVMRDFWNENEVRVDAGSVIDVPVEQAMDGVESGALSRAKDGKK
jgi:hypothetical protein